MALNQNDLQQVKRYVEAHISEWLPVPALQLNERFVRLEEELKHQRELMQQGFQHTDKRFTTLTWMLGVGFVVITSLTTVFALLA